MLVQLPVPEWLTPRRAILALAILVSLLIAKRVRRALRRRGPARLNPKLARYGERSPDEINAELEAAARIVATSSTGRIAGFQLVRQIETVFVEGHRSPDEAVTALKATAARRGGNALINLAHERTPNGRCSARADAAVVRESGAGPAPTA